MSRRITAGTLAAVAVGLLLAGVARFSGADPSRAQQVVERGASVMPFDLDATTHVFDPTPAGGVQTVVADDPTDTDEVELVREHLREEERRFRIGDFGDPVTIHGDEMPGVDVLEARFDELDTAYRDLPDGGEITYLSSDPEVVLALHEWFEAQLDDHGDHAEGA